MAYGTDNDLLLTMYRAHVREQLEKIVLETVKEVMDKAITDGLASFEVAVRKMYLCDLDKAIAEVVLTDRRTKP